MSAGVFRKWVCRVLCLVACLGMMLEAVSVSAFERKDHDAMLETILFGSKYTDGTRPLKLYLLENAIAISIDQANGKDQGWLDELNNAGITGIPKTVEVFNLRKTGDHRKYTHLGWTYTYDDDIAKWSEYRKPLLIKTARFVFYGEEKKLFGLIPLNKAASYMDNDEIEMFCGMCYYIHLLGDHADADCFDKIKTDAILSVDKIIEDMEVYLEAVFGEYTSRYSYIQMIAELDRIKQEARKAVREDDFEAYEKLVKFDRSKQDYGEIVKTLKTTLPGLLQELNFFKEVFPEKKTNKEAA